MELQSLIEKILNNYYGDQLERNYANSMQLNGWLLNEPLIKETYRGGKMAIFMLYQLTKGNYYKAFLLKTYSNKVIDLLEQQKNVCLINCLGLLSSSPKNGATIQVEEIAINIEYTNFKLNPPYTPKSER